MRLALFEPDIPQNTGTMIRLGACMGVPVEIIEPCGFLFGDAQMRRAGMDYLEIAAITKHISWRAFNETRQGWDARLVLLSTKADVAYTDFAFHPDDILMVGRESAGAPDEVHAAAEGRVLIPMKAEARSINVALSVAMVLGEALRQTNQFPGSN